MSKSIIVNINNSYEYTRCQINDLKKQLSLNYEKISELIGSPIKNLMITKDEETNEHWVRFEYELETDILPQDLEFFHTESTKCQELKELQESLNDLNELVKELYDELFSLSEENRMQDVDHYLKRYEGIIAGGVVWIKEKLGFHLVKKTVLTDQEFDETNEHQIRIYKVLAKVSQIIDYIRCELIDLAPINTKVMALLDDIRSTSIEHSK